MSDHGRWEQLAVEHVLGGLTGEAAATFRAHLLECRQCRNRVSELRDLAADLTAVEREERTLQRLKTAARSEIEPDREGAAVAERHLVPIVMVALAVLAIVVVGWNLHLRAENAELRRATNVREATLAALGEGLVVPASFDGGVTGVVVADAERIAFSLAGVPEFDDDRVLVAWVTVDGREVPVWDIESGAIVGGLIATTITESRAARLRIIITPTGADAATKTGQILLDADLTTVRPGLRPSEPAADAPSEA